MVKNKVMNFKLIINGIILLFNKYVLKKSTGESLKIFCSNMGVAYIKLGQILATNNFGDVFTEKDRRDIQGLCDSCERVPFKKIDKIIKNTYKHDEIVRVWHKPLGYASVSQVHKARLQDGSLVVLKIKREDIEKDISKQIKQMKFILKHFGKHFNFYNQSGGKHALDMFIGWIEEEIDFKHEVKNIKEYQNFVESVNGKVRNTVKIVIPRVYEELCTDKIIVLEYIKYDTLNKMELTESNKERIIKGINSYLQLSLYALLNNKKVVFHGDPHLGNIFITDDNNIGFLDMGLIFKLSEDEAQLTRELFLNAFNSNKENLTKILEKYLVKGKNGIERDKLLNSINEYTANIKDKTVTHYFTYIMNMCVMMEFQPPDFLFKLAKAFVYLGGIDEISGNDQSCKVLLKKQVMEYILINKISTGIVNIKKLIHGGAYKNDSLSRKQS